MKLPPRRVLMLVFGAFCVVMGVYWALTGQRTGAIVWGVLAFFWLVWGAISPGRPKG